MNAKNTPGDGAIREHKLVIIEQCRSRLAFVNWAASCKEHLAARGVQLNDVGEAQLKERLLRFITARAAGRERVTVHLAFDATVLQKSWQVVDKFGALVGKVEPNHLVPVTAALLEDLKKNGTQVEDLAPEIKCASLAMQDCPAGLSPFFLPAGRPQVKNDPGPEFNKRVVDAVAALAPQVQLVSVCTDGVAYESEFIVPGLIKFLQGESPTLYFLDCNHTVKALRGQICYGSGLGMVGTVPIVPALLAAANIKPELFRVSDYASDLVVQKLCSLDTISSLMALNAEPLEPRRALAITLFFLAINAHATNANDLPTSVRIAMKWMSLLWFTSMTGLHPITMRNMAVNAHGAIWLYAREDVKVPSLGTEEACEHAFGWARDSAPGARREFTAAELVTSLARARRAGHGGIIPVSATGNGEVVGEGLRS
eukprot:jgi/Mesvir1/10732/Mv13805-RA.1